MKQSAASRGADVCRGSSAMAREHAPTTQRDTQIYSETCKQTFNLKPVDITDIKRDIHTEIYKQTYRYIEKDRQIHRQIQTDIYRHTDTDKHTDREMQTDRDKHTYRGTDGHRHTHTDTDKHT